MFKPRTFSAYLTALGLKHDFLAVSEVTHTASGSYDRRAMTSCAITRAPSTPTSRNN